jgi:hypothetical protein
MPSLKAKILKYKEKNELTYRELAELLHLDQHQNLYHWLHTEIDKETFSDRMERRFKEVLAEG